MRIKIYVQSASDIITNSSSEIFCTITSKDFLEEIHDVLIGVFGYGDYEIDPVVNMEEDCITIDLPYNLSGSATFFEAGIKAILDEKFKDNYEIEF